VRVAGEAVEGAGERVQAIGDDLLEPRSAEGGDASRRAACPLEAVRDDGAESDVVRPHGEENEVGRVGAGQLRGESDLLGPDLPLETQGPEDGRMVLDELRRVRAAVDPGARAGEVHERDDDVAIDPLEEPGGAARAGGRRAVTCGVPPDVRRRALIPLAGGDRVPEGEDDELA